MGLKNFFEKLTGLDKLKEQATAEVTTAIKLAREAEESAKLALQVKEEAELATVKAKEEAELAKLSQKERATRKNEPWVGVLETRVNKDNVRNGFFEIDWNEAFVLKLKQDGYGANGDNDEEIVDRWFRELCANVVVDGDFGGPVSTGMIDIATVKNNNDFK